MITMFLSERTQCLYYSLETGNTKIQAAHFFSPFNSREQRKLERDEFRPHHVVRNIQTGYAKWKPDSRCTPGQEDTYLGAKNMEKVKVKVAQLCLTLFDPTDYTVQGLLQARILEWVAFPFSRGIFPTQGSNPGLPHCRRILYQLSHKGSPIIRRGNFKSRI